MCTAKTIIPSHSRIMLPNLGCLENLVVIMTLMISSSIKIQQCLLMCLSFTFCFSVRFSDCNLKEIMYNNYCGKVLLIKKFEVAFFS